MKAFCMPGHRFVVTDRLIEGIEIFSGFLYIFTLTR